MTARVTSAVLAPGGELTLTTKDDLLVGRFRVEALNGKTVATQTRLVFSESYAGATALDLGFNRIGLVARAEQDRIELVAPPSAGLALPGSDVWLSSVGPGDRLESPFVYEWSRK